MEFYNGPTWIVGDPKTEDCCVFDNEEMAIWFQKRRSVHAMSQGSQSIDDGNFFMTPEERNEILKKEPGLEKFIHKVLGSKEFIQNIERYCFWLVDASPAEIRKSKILYERVQKVKEFRLSRKSKAAIKAAERPHLFLAIRQPKTEYLLIPRVSSEKRKYIPMGYISPDVIVTDAAFALPHATPYHFGILTSSAHMGWMRRVCGRLRMDYRYSSTLCYNNFIWPSSTPWQVHDIEAAAQKILDVRAQYPDCSYADLYDEMTMPTELRKAHKENDDAVLDAYKLQHDIEEDDLVMYLFRLYYKKLGRELPE